MIQSILISVLFGVSILYLANSLWRAFRIPKQGECGGSCACSTPTKSQSIVAKHLKKQTNVQA